MLMKIIMPKEVHDLIKGLGNKTIQNSGLKIYTALYLRTNRADKHGYFDCPASYLKTINSRYEKIMDRFIEARIIKYKENIKPNPNDIFSSIWTKDYSADIGYCMKYKFLIDITNGEEIEVKFYSNRPQRWYQTISQSLISLGYLPKIKRDNFGRRVYHTLTNSYKRDLKGKGLSVIDAKASQPTLLWLIMKSRNIFDKRYFHVFENNIDFYQYVSDNLELANKDAAKKLFMFWVNDKGYVPHYGIYQLFPKASAFIKNLKSDYYKDSPAFLQREEARIWIDDLLNNIPVEFALPIHDSLIVHESDCEVILNYCQLKYPDISFSVKKL